MMTMTTTTMTAVTMIKKGEGRSGPRPTRVGLLLLAGVQFVCASFFIWQIIASVFGFAPFSWQIYEIIEIGAAIGLILGGVFGGLLMRRIWIRNQRVEGQLRAASGAFMGVLDEHFDSWGLTPAERDVALFAIKGLTTMEIAQLRETSEGTVKAQTNAIFRKAGVAGRPQLLSLFIEDLMDGPLAN